MNDKSPFLKEYERIREEPNAQKRGYDLQGLVGRILGNFHFTVEPKAHAASPRQIDLFASRADSVYLIETKWRRDPANINDIDSLYTRLEAVPPKVIGLLVSHSGFTRPVLDRVREKSSRPVILLSGSELERVLQWDGNLLGLLRRKIDALLVHRAVLLDETPRSNIGARSLPDPSALPSGGRIFVFPDGTRSRCLQCSGSFDRFTFVPDLEDIDWASSGGFGVTLDVVLPLQQQSDFFDLLHRLSRMGWVTRKGCWSIQQATAVWHGFGSEVLVDELSQWKRRYQGLETHHTEEVCYTDECEDGFYTLIAQFSADRRRIVWRVEMSFQLRGIPLDPGSYRELYDHFGLAEPVYFRPRSEKSREWGRPPSRFPVVKPLAFVVEVDGLMAGYEEEWAAGIVVLNPFFEGRPRAKRPPTWVPEMVSRSEYLVCALRSWHILDDPKSCYELWGFEWAWTSDGLIVRALADWPDEPDGDVPVLTSEAEEGRSHP